MTEYKNQTLMENKHIELLAKEYLKRFDSFNPQTIRQFIKDGKIKYFDVSEALSAMQALETAIASVIGQERVKIDEMADAMREFCERVEKGEIRSVKTYNKFKSILSDLTPPKTKEE